jgi:hypothetical protein
MCKIVRRGSRRGDVASVAMSGFFIRTLDFYQRHMKGEELLGEILRPVGRALGWIVAGALIMLFVYVVVVYVVPVIRRRLYGNE